LANPALALRLPFTRPAGWVGEFESFDGLAHLVKTSSIQIDGVDYEWWVHHQPTWVGGEGWKGLALTVQPADSPTRQLILEFPMEYRTRHSTPHRQRPTVSRRRLAECVRAAMSAGWEPASRGKPFVYEVDRAV
jgi:hypothetical protein